MAVAARGPKRLSGHRGWRNGSRSTRAVEASPLLPAVPTRERSWVGELANTALTVSLNWRTLENPAAKATSAMGREVVSMSTLAVWARWALAMAMGPAPTSA